ncbi:F1 complex, delta/epsilon subunit of ATPase [Protomyces lactucae-debilis]|uniref:ATP synthase subunit delta, mitochondrial n=1 Tax=Protomyces lactucae-debilis TaxID=2754530 RepID=A0A1Y2F751_PROLT|nr:F1 complex, delta/epsilon subunit of ATPase [Protomyces lactucae-debilis]ORY79487.1 F1 complex, delta/epsilon subunit of ATPase [Protomyces lactucae-debilis]
MFRNALRAASRQTPATMLVAKRGYAEAVPTDKIRLSLTMPHQAVFANKDVVQVNIPATSGDMGVLANHVPSIEQLKAGVLEIFTDGGSKEDYFVSGGFAIVQPGSKLSINAVEAYKVEDFSKEAITSNLQEAQRIASGSGSEEDIAEAKIQIEVLEALNAYVK